MDYVIVSSGVRYNRDKISGEEVCPSFGLVGRPRDGTTLRAVASKGFRAPQLNELYMFPPSNKELKAETVWSYEMGLRQRAFNLLFFDIAAFRMEGENFIESGRNSSPPPMYLFQNTGSFEFQGVEATIDANWKDILKLGLSYSYLERGSWTRGRPGRKYGLSAAYTSERFILRVTGNRVDDYYAGNNHEDEIDAYTVFSLYSEAGLADGLRVFAGVDNIFDEEYVLFVDLPGGSAGLYEMPGRNFIFGLRYGM